jgi:hypothetical protein
LWDGLEGAWIPGLGPTGDVLHDVSGNKRNAVPNAFSLSASWNSPVADPPISNTFSVPQATATRYRLDIENTPFPNNNTRWDSITLIAWLKPNASVENNKSGIILGAGNNSNGTSNGVRLFQGNTGGSSHFGMRANNNTAEVALGGITVFDEWYYLAGTADVNDDLVTLTKIRHSLGIDSLTKVTDEMLGSIEQNNYQWRIGGQPGADDNPDGDYGPCMVYGRKLSDQEIRLLYADPLAPFRLRRQVMFAAPTEAAAAAYHIYLSMLETGRFGINNGQLGVRES